MRMFLIDVINGTAGEVDIKPTLENYYNILNCNCIDIAVRSVEGIYYDFIIDDEGLLKEPAIPCVLNKRQRPMLVGNCLICLHDNEGNEVELDKKDITLIQNNLLQVFNATDKKYWKVLSGVEY